MRRLSAFLKKYQLTAILFLAVACVFTGISIAQKQADQTLSQRWQKVEEYAQKQLPESALKELDDIIRQAEADKNSTELIKAQLYKMRFTLERQPDKSAEVISDFKTMTRKTASDADRALIQSMLAEMYSRFYFSNSWNINKRTSIGGTAPADLNEWTKVNFTDTIFSLLNKSLLNPDQLKNKNIEKYNSLLITDSTANNLYPTLFDLLAHRKINLLSELYFMEENKNMPGNALLFAPAEEFIATKPDSSAMNFINFQTTKTYQDLLAFHQSDVDHKTFIYNDINRLKYMYEKTNNATLYLNALERLEKKYPASDATAEVLIAKAEYYFQQSYNSELSKTYRKTTADICKKGITQFPNYSRIGLLKNLLAQLEQKSLTVSHPSIAQPGSALKVRVFSNNIFKLKIETYKINATAKDYFLYRQNDRGLGEKYPNRTLTGTTYASLTENNQYLTVDTTLAINTQGYGIYEFFVSEANNENAAEKSVSNYTVTDMGFIQRSIKTGQQQVYALNRWTGKQLPAVSISGYSQNWNGSKYALIPKALAKTDKNGLTLFSYDNKNYDNKILFFENGNDKYFSSNSYTYYYDGKQYENKEPLLQLFTDRAVYRPGQRVYFKGIAYTCNATSNAVIAGKSYEVILYNANNEKISSMQLKTNDFGSVTGEFTLPASGLNGAYSIRCGKKRHSFYVEEYKRPGFEVKFEKTKDQLRFGNKLTVEGSAKAYAGYAVSNATVKYRVMRSSHIYCSWWYSPATQVASGDTQTDDNGKFAVSFVAEKPQNTTADERGSIFTYTVYADITDNKGETQQGTQSVSVGDKALFILASVPDKINKTKKLKLDISTETINGEKLNSSLTYTVQQLTTNGYYGKDETQSIAGDIVMQGNYNTTDKILNIDASRWKSGLYRILLKTTDSFGNEVKTTSDFVLFGNDDKKPPVKSYIWIETENTELTPGEKAVVHFGTSTANTPVLYELMLGNTVLESKWIVFNNEIKDFNITLKPEYGAGVNASFSLMKDGEFFQRKVAIKRKIAEKKLSPYLSVFRNKLLPGEKAEWTISVPESAAGKTAEVMVGMYDASLDAIRYHNWAFQPVYTPSVLNSPDWIPSRNDLNSGSMTQNISFVDVPLIANKSLNWFGLTFNNIGLDGVAVGTTSNIRIRGGGPVKRISTGAVAAADLEIVTEDAVQFSKTGFAPPVAEEVVVGYATTKTKAPEVKVRTNFNETAFFYPQLQTDSKGNVNFSFTAPESLTRWNVKMLAHTPDLFSGYAQSQVITQKEMMVQMNLPRFVRRSDLTTVGASVINLSDKVQSANVHFEISDPVSSNILFSADKKIDNIPVSQNRSIDFKIPALTAGGLVVCRIVATTENFSDGEQKYLPVLPDKILVTETMPLTIRANSSRTYRFDDLLKAGKSVDNRNLTIEIATNPAWYAIQALPSLAEPENNNAFDLTTAIYANTLAAFIVQSSPSVVSVFSQWKQSGNTDGALKSQLEKNQELKNMLLDETPWVMAAGNDKEQIQRIAQLFDQNKQNYQAEQVLAKLIKLQTTEGGFAWFDGMPASRYVTQEIVLQMGRLARLTKGTTTVLSDDRFATLIKKALNYLDLEIAGDYARLKKSNKNYLSENCITNIQLMYLHLRSEFSSVPVQVSATEAVRYYTQQSEKYYTSFTLYGKAMMAVVAHRNGKMAIAGNILKSLRENALTSDDNGMYWAKNTAGYYWNERPVAVQTAMIEAFSETGATAAELDELKIGLLRQKQTQHWDSPIASANAVYALLLQGNDWLNNKGNIQLQYGSETRNTSPSDAGTGYIKIAVDGNNVKPEMGNINIRSTLQTGISWGAAYWQYYQDVDKVNAKGAGLRISKTLYLKPGGAASAIPLTQAKPKTGDRIMTRLVISTDRDLEFVALKDLRAACLEPVEQRSGAVWKENLCYYQTTKDASTQFFFNFLPRGTYVFEYEQWINNAGTFSSGIATVQCQYAPEFAAHSSGEKITISDR